MSNFNDALTTGKVVVLQTRTNTNSSKNQVGVQFIQRIKSGGSTSALVALAQGIEDAGYTKGTAWFSFNADVIAKLGLEADKNYRDADEVVYGSDLFDGAEVNIQITENTEANPDNPGLTPKINPQTAEVQMFNGAPIYRHTTLVAGTAVNTFLKANKVATGTTTVNETENAETVV